MPFSNNIVLYSFVRMEHQRNYKITPFDLEEGKRGLDKE